MFNLDRKQTLGRADLVPRPSYFPLVFATLIFYLVGTTPPTLSNMVRHGVPEHRRHPTMWVIARHPQDKHGPNTGSKTLNRENLAQKTTEKGNQLYQDVSGHHATDRTHTAVRLQLPGGCHVPFETGHKPIHGTLSRSTFHATYLCHQKKIRRSMPPLVLWKMQCYI
jgi:hypothetical protein